MIFNFDNCVNRYNRIMASVAPHLMTTATDTRNQADGDNGASVKTPADMYRVAKQQLNDRFMDPNDNGGFDLQDKDERLEYLREVGALKRFIAWYEKNN